MARILIFGNSIVHGYWDDELGGWVNRLKIFCMDHNEDIIVHNFGSSGNTTNELLDRFEFETEQLAKKYKELIVILSVGVNDCGFIHSKNDLQVIPKKFEENINKLTKLAKKFSNRIIFVGIHNVIDDMTSPVPWNSNISYKNNNIKDYNDLIKLACDENKIHFINIFDLFKKDDFYSDDGLHPGPKGHEKILNIVRDFLITNKWI